MPPGPRAAAAGRRLTLVAVAAVAVAIVAALPRIPQDPAYHRFADARPLLGIPNVLDVASNGPLVVVGLLGLVVAIRRRAGSGPEAGWAPHALFAAVAASGLGSALYHWAPSNATLVWDRLALAAAAVSLLAWVLADRVHPWAGTWILGMLLLAGLASVVHWDWSERAGAGDLRYYALVQFFPVVAIPLALALFPGRWTRGADLLAALGWYAAAKVGEHLDAEIFRATGEVVSGHTLKHLCAALAGWHLVRMLCRVPGSRHGGDPGADVGSGARAAPNRRG